MQVEKKKCFISLLVNNIFFCVGCGIGWNCVSFQYLFKRFKCVCLKIDDEIWGGISWVKISDGQDDFIDCSGSIECEVIVFFVGIIFYFGNIFFSIIKIRQ